MKFFKGLLVFILIAIIIGGIGYIGYSLFFADHSAHNGAVQNQQSANANTNNANTNTSANYNQTNQNSQGMQHGTVNNQTQNNNNQQSANNQLAINQSNIILQNKEKLGKSLASINEALRLMTADPYASDLNTGNISGTTNSQVSQQNTAATALQPEQGNNTAVTNPGNNTTINIFPQGNNQPAIQSNTMAQMPNMGITYDANKMEQLHTGLYKIAVGKALLEQLNNELIYQAEYAANNTQDLAYYYSNQYNLTVQNRNKLNLALTNINEAANLVNINPYVSANGLVYDKDRMNYIHQSIQKLAEGVSALNQLNDDFNRQSIALSNSVQYYINNANNLNNQQMNHGAMSSGLFGGLFDNINMGSVVNIVLILFVVGLIASIFGFISSLFKSPTPKYKEEELI